jgi:biopolymer transport protein ExbD
MPARPDALAAEPNVTPMIDVLLVLLITFMMMVSVRQAITAQLPPPADGTVQPRGAPPLVLTVEAGPRYTLNQQPVAPAALASTLASVFAPRPEKVLFVAGRPGATYQQVVSAMDVARGAGVRVIGIAPGTGAAR